MMYINVNAPGDATKSKLQVIRKTILIRHGRRNALGMRVMGQIFFAPILLQSVNITLQNNIIMCIYISMISNIHLSMSLVAIN